MGTMVRLVCCSSHGKIFNLYWGVDQNHGCEQSQDKSTYRGYGRRSGGEKSRLFLSVGEPARKMFKDKHPNLSVWTLGVRDMIERCRNCFHVAPNRTLDRHKFLSRKQQNNESLQQFWHALNGLASRCELGEITQTLVHDVFILNMNNKKVQEKLCVEPFDDPQDALKYAISYEEGVKRQKTMGIGVAESSKTAIKTEPVCAVEKVNKRNYFHLELLSYSLWNGRKHHETFSRKPFSTLSGFYESHFSGARCTHANHMTQARHLLRLTECLWENNRKIPKQRWNHTLKQMQTLQACVEQNLEFTLLYGTIQIQ